MPDMDAFGKLADAGFARDTATITAGYAAAAGMDIALDAAADRDVPNEAVGLGSVVAMEYAPGISGRQMRHAQLGAGAYAALAFADRIGVRSAVEEAL